MQHLIRRIRILTLYNLTLTSLFLVGVVQASAVPIGDITEQTGITSLLRLGESISVASVNMNDTAVTGNGRMMIEFLDEEQLALTEHTRIYIDEVYYDPDPSLSKMTMRMARGTARFTSGRGKRIDKSNISLSTPTAKIGILGTDFTSTIDEIGRSLIILLPDEKTGESSGQIVITNDGGTVVLSEAYHASIVNSYDSPPSRPVTLVGINASMISNIFIVNEPKEIKEVKEKEGLAIENDSDNILDVDFLEFDELEKDYLGDDELEFTDLDIDYLDVDFLQDLLDVVNLLDKKSALDRDTLTDGSITLDGTALGFDTDTQYNSILDKGLGTIKFYRAVNGIISITLASNTSAIINTTTDQKDSSIMLNNGQNIIINIEQRN
jgi:hypothetical protein